MKFFQKRGVAIVVLILAIVASSAWGLHKTPAVSTPEGGEKLDPSLSTAAFEQYVRDEANVLSDKTEKAVSLYNANWDKMFGSIMAVVTTESANDIENAAYDYAIEMQLAENDAILVIAKQQQDYYLVASGDFYDLLSGLSQSFVASCMADNVQKGDYDAAVRSLCAALHVELSQQYQQSEAALEANRALIGRDTYLMTLQNGSGHEEVLRRFADDAHIVIGTTQHNSAVTGNGEICHGGSGWTHIGPLVGDAARLEPIREAFASCGLETDCKQDIKRLIWQKMLTNVSASMLTGVLQVPMGFIAENPSAWAICETLVREAVAVAAGEGIEFDADEKVAEVRKVCTDSPAGLTSIYADLRDGRRTEVDTISGSVIRASERNGVPAPTHRAMVQLVHAMEQKHQA